MLEIIVGANVCLQITAHDDKAREDDKERTTFHAGVTVVTGVAAVNFKTIEATGRQVHDLRQRLSTAKWAVATSKTSSARARAVNADIPRRAFAGQAPLALHRGESHRQRTSSDNTSRIARCRGKAAATALDSRSQRL